MRNATFASSLVLAAIAVSGARAEDVVIVDYSGRFVETFNAADGASKSFETIKGLPGRERIISIDVRPKDGALYAISTKGYYVLDPTTGWAQSIGPEFDTPLSNEARLEFVRADVVDRTTDAALIFTPTHFAGTRAGLNDFLRLDPDFGDRISPRPTRNDPPAVVYAPEDPAAGLKADFTLGSTATTLFGVDGSRRTLVRIDPQDGGPALATTIGDLGVPSTMAAFGFDIAHDGAAYLMRLDYTTFRSVVYSVDLTSGAATPISALSELFSDMAVDPRYPYPERRPLTVSKAAVRLNFKRSGADVIELAGTLSAPPGGWSGSSAANPLKGASVRVSIAGQTDVVDQINRAFIGLNTRDSTVSRSDSFVAPRARGERPARFRMKLSRASFPQLDRDAASASGPLTFTVDFLVDSMPYRTTLTLDYVARPGRGTATTPRR